jgi:hypothetical protein
MQVNNPLLRFASVLLIATLGLRATAQEPAATEVVHDEPASVKMPRSTTLKVVEIDDQPKAREVAETGLKGERTRQPAKNYDDLVSPSQGNSLAVPVDPYEAGSDESQAILPKPPESAQSEITIKPANPSPVGSRERTPRSAEMDAVIRRANAANRHAFELAEHGAIYSARAEFVTALQIIADGLDARQDNNEHERMLNAGLKALSELDDFSGRHVNNEGSLPIAQIVARHETPVLKDMPQAQLTTRMAINDYLTYAEQQLAASQADIPAGSAALYGLGKIYTVPPSEHGPTDATHGAKAVAIHEAALAIDGRNYRAANELGVLLVRLGRLPEARAALMQSLAISPQPATWRNLAVVHRAMRENQLAEHASKEGQLLADRERQMGISTDAYSSQVRWVDSETFARSTETAIDATPATNSSTAPAHHSMAESLSPSTYQR